MERKCNLIVDSCCDLPYDVVNREGVYLVRFPFFFDEEEHLDDLWNENDPHEFYERMRKGEQPTTAQASIPVLRKTFEEAAADGLPCVYLSFTSGLSASYDQACLVADQVKAEHPEFDLRIVDTYLASTAEAVIVFEALRQQERGLTADEMEKWACEARYFANVYFMVEDLECLHRGGRIPASVAVVGSKLDVKPIVTIAADGTLSVKGVARGRKKGLRQLVQLYMDRVDSTAAPFVCVGNADCPKDMKKMEEILVKEAGKEPVFVEQPIGPVIGSHVGPGMVSLCFWGKDRREDVSLTDKIARKVKGE